MRARVTALALVAGLLTSLAASAASIDRQKTISEAELRRMSAAAYSELLRQAEGKGHRYAPELVARGYARHLEELRLQLEGEGYIVLAGEAGA